MATAPNVDDLLNGATLRVVLRPHRNAQTDPPDTIQSFELPHITLIGDRFFAKTAARHAASFQLRDYDLNTAYSYAYSNYYDFVVNCSLTESVSRIRGKKVHADVAFVTPRNYELVWCSEQDPPAEAVEAVETAILSGRRLKTALLDGDDIWNIHPVHMPSFYVDKNFFELFTEQDAMPVFFRRTEELEAIGSKYKSFVEDHLRENAPETKAPAYNDVTMLNPDTEFYSNYYTIRSQGDYLHGKLVVSQEDPRRYKALKVFAEA
ncbi:MAG: hypothetical protein WD407_13725 [Rhodospirillales bacterium]